METMTKTVEQKKHGLQEKLELAKAMGLVAQIALIESEMKEIHFEQRNIYPEVTKQEAQAAMCEKTIYSSGLKDKIMGCRFILRYQLAAIQEWPEFCQRRRPHIHETFLQALSSEVVGFGQRISFSFGLIGEAKESTVMPMAALLRLKEAKEKDCFDSFEIWRPETKDEQKARLLDPWLVGVRGKRYFKLCDWR